MFKKIIHRYILVAVLVVALFGAPFIASALPEGVSKAIKSNVDILERRGPSRISRERNGISRKEMSTIRITLPHSKK